METTMELDELKTAWQAIDRRLQQQTALNLFVFREGKLDKVRASLRRLYWGKIGQILFGDALIYFGIMSTLRYHATPHLLTCSVAMLAYGVLIVVLGGVTIGKVSGIDYAAPVLEIQKRVAALHRLYILGNQCAGLPWWLLWLAIFVLEVKANMDIDLFEYAPLFVLTSAAVGFAGLFGSLCLGYLARDPRRRRLADFIDQGMSSASLRKARTFLAEIERFERT